LELIEWDETILPRPVAVHCAHRIGLRTQRLVPLFGASDSRASPRRESNRWLDATHSREDLSGHRITKELAMERVNVLRAAARAAIAAFAILVNVGAQASGSCGARSSGLERLL
jgi:hypothetical protein